MNPQSPEMLSSFGNSNINEEYIKVTITLRLGLSYNPGLYKEAVKANKQNVENVLRVEDITWPVPWNINPYISQNVQQIIAGYTSIKIVAYFHRECNRYMAINNRIQEDTTMGAANLC